MAEKGRCGDQPDRDDLSNGAPHSSSSESEDATPPRNQVPKPRTRSVTEQLEALKLADQQESGGASSSQPPPLVEVEGAQPEDQADGAARDDSSSEEIPIGAEASDLHHPPSPVQQNAEAGAENDIKPREESLGAAAAAAVVAAVGAGNAETEQQQRHRLGLLSCSSAQMRRALYLVRWRFTKRKDRSGLPLKVLTRCSVQPPPEVETPLMERLIYNRIDFKIYTLPLDGGASPPDHGLSEQEQAVMDNILRWLRQLLTAYHENNPKDPIESDESD